MKDFALRGFDVKSPDILPSLFQERDQEIDAHVNVLSELFFSKGESSNGSTHAKDLLQLESDGGFQFFNLLSNVFRFSDRDWELVDLVEDVTSELWDLLDDRLRSDELVIWLSPLFD